MTLASEHQAPDFDVISSDGRALKSADFRGKKNVVLYFYPQDFTAVCTRETCGFRDMYEDLKSQDTEVIGVSFDDDESHEKFRKEYNVAVRARLRHEQGAREEIRGDEHPPQDHRQGGARHLRDRQEGQDRRLFQGRAVGGDARERRPRPSCEAVLIGLDTPPS